MGKNFKQLTFDDRYMIEKLLNQKVSKIQIAEYVGVHISTIYREIRRGTIELHNTNLKEIYKYDAYYANENAVKNKQKCGANLKLMLGCDYLKFVSTKIIKDKYSPRAVIMFIKDNNLQFEKTLSDYSLYRYIRLGFIDGLTQKNLHYKIIKNKYEKHKRKRVASGDSIEKRPKEILSREEFGHWEMDTVVGMRGESKNSLLVLTERKTRYEIIFKLENHSAEEVVKKINMVSLYLKSLFKKIFKTFTCDNGTEFADNKSLSKFAKIFYCHPYSSWERGSNENANRLIRYFIPKGMNFDSMTNTDIKEIEKWVNNYPRKIFNGKTSKAKLKQELKILKIDFQILDNIA